MFDQILDVVLSYPKLKERLGNSKNLKSDKEIVSKHLKEIYADFSKGYHHTVEKILDVTIPKLYDGVNLNSGDTDLKKLSKDSCVVLVPNHQSHADYLAINYVVYKKYKIPLYVAGGKNLNIFPIGTLFRKSGSFFIRRSFSSDILYKLTLEGYLYYLLSEQKVIEFFFEGGRSRTGKLRSPRFGLYRMLLDAHQELPAEKKKPLNFVPVSIVHEYVAETKSLARELGGGKKVKENTKQLFGLLKLFSYQFGNVHINFGKPVEAVVRDGQEVKEAVQELAFDCFREVGKQMLVTPTSLLALIMLDDVDKALKWNDIVSKAKPVLDYCHKFNVPVTKSLSLKKFEKSLARALDILIGNKKIDIIGKKGPQGHTFYTIKEECRTEVLYFKNTILHHFLVPWIINSAWLGLFSGSITNVDDLKKLFLDERYQLKHEFYLPTVKEFFYLALDIISDAIGRKIESLDECMQLSNKEIYAIAAKLSVFSRSCSYINEAYYLSGVTLMKLWKEKGAGFKRDEYMKTLQEVHEEEISIERIINYPESFSIPLAESSLNYFQHQGMIGRKEGLFVVNDEKKLELTIKKSEQKLMEQFSFNLRV